MLLPLAPALMLAAARRSSSYRPMVAVAAVAGPVTPAAPTTTAVTILQAVLFAAEGA